MVRIRSKESSTKEASQEGSCSSSSKEAPQEGSS